ncbi:uroporphyrinogen-III synthase [Ornithinibacillus massiliensis]|uniref:Uroporphyrinogen-III synthase n=1 Tax=Ornithinibacillus massiliensis TaxID=1944633 RepID=A0ABS5MAT3_9BACI|nr:uroporphyrinogen-III synthase [Ornithinibacillus massiliensis]MBS3679437.1 uroporphyrinogen-III synthase [Ornithinibacillus massiliensis]
MLPLAGKNVLVTREASLAKKFTNQLLDNGANVYEVPLLKITSRSAVDIVQRLQNMDTLEWIFFTSVNGVDCFFSILEEEDVTLDNVKIAVVGKKTATVLANYGYKPDFVPSIYDGENLVIEFLEKYQEIKQVLLVQGNRSRDVVAKGLSKAGVQHQSLVVYDTNYNFDVETKLRQVLEKVSFDFITFTSPSTVEAFTTFSTMTLPEYTKIVCIGKTTEARARQLGFKNMITPETYTIESMIEVMLMNKRED